ncbi:activating signal cointegrator 1 complex subunit 1-like [Agrilus planipennis]|uniref:Activating signal cointegrator 1 complex subunit 1-like n=1 Tax=Agrilus planipennis TaxID=224129 RepID=A0A1W4XUZ2_AGRPL|nr:activating signal cointegrator 1 complex subunit 1-like [Agrilus planipennis]
MNSSNNTLMTTNDSMIFNKPEIFTEPGGYQFRSFESFYKWDRHKNSENVKKTLPAYTDNEDCLLNCEELDDGYEIKITKSGKFLTDIHAASYFIPFIVGTQGLTKKEIEMSTRTKLRIPKHPQNNILITGNNERDVAYARNRIHMIILAQREKHQMTHFISIRVFSSSIKENFETFRHNILNGPSSRGIHPSIFQKAEKLHLTISPLVLLDDIEIDWAISALNECKNEVVKHLMENVDPPLYIQMEGVEIMNDDPTDVDILYGKVKVDPEKYHSIFQTLVNKITTFFYLKGLIKRRYDDVKLHVTLMNSLYRKKDFRQQEDSIRESFDATYILEKYKNYYFGVVELDFIHLSVRFGTTRNNGNSYYESLTSIPLY